MRIAYIENARLPTEKAHGYQIMKTCEALVNAGAEVQLFVADRRNPLGDRDVLEYYGIPSSFDVFRLPVVDFLPHPDRGARRRAEESLRSDPSASLGMKLAYSIERRSFLRSIRRARLALLASDVWYTRDPILAETLISLPNARPVFVELHNAGARVKEIVSKVSGWIVISEGLKRYLVEQGVVEDRITVAHDGFDPDAFAHLPSREEARRMLGIDPFVFLAVYAGHLYSWKGVDSIATAFSKMPDGIELAIVGGYPQDIERVKGLAGDASRVKFVGHQSRKDVLIWLSAADAAMLPTSAQFEIGKSYTSPLKLFEYLAAGLPVIASDVPSSREILDESVATFFKPDDAEDFLRALQEAKNKKHEARISKEKVKGYSWGERGRRVNEFVVASVAKQSRTGQNIAVIDGFCGKCDSNWKPWLKAELENKGYEPKMLALPNSCSPDFDECLSFLRKELQGFGPNDIVIGHSLGGYFAIKISEEKEFGTLILVAPTTGKIIEPQTEAGRAGKDFDALKRVISHGVQLENIKVKKKVLFFDRKDDRIPFETTEEFDASWQKHLTTGKGHFATRDKVFEFPELLSVVTARNEVTKQSPLCEFEIASSSRFGGTPRNDRGVLIITQAVDEADTNLSFFLDWLRELSSHVSVVHVAAWKVGSHTLPSNVHIHAMPKGKLKRMIALKKLTWKVRRDIDAVFVHMLAPVAASLGWFWRLLGKRVVLWYTHGSVPAALHVANLFVHGICTATSPSMNLKTVKKIVTGHGIDTERFRPGDVPRLPEILTVGRITPRKRLESLLDLVEAVHRAQPSLPLRLRIVGEAYLASDRAYADALAAEVARRGLGDLVSFDGAKLNADLIERYRRGAVFVTASETGSLDKAVLEALSCGTPVLAASRVFSGFDGVHVAANGWDEEAIAFVVSRLMHPSTDAAARADVIRKASLKTLISRLVSILLD
ncbi:glycosyltransferase [Candidatus Uhrbacteria bacterium]|nr:MAG: glycosyltransferase [Candidatus Uhrbacteria bacterium]